MSKKEMENLDEQVLQVANRSGEEKNDAAVQRAEQEEARRAKELHAKEIEEMERKAAKEVARWKMKHLLKMLAKVVACLVGGALFLALVLEPAFWAPVVGCAGILTFVVAAAICVDRYVQHYKEWWR